MPRTSTPVIVQIVQQCAHCQKYKPTTTKEPMVPTLLLDRPWQMFGMDLLDFNGQQYMVVVNYSSGISSSSIWPIPSCTWLLRNQSTSWRICPHYYCWVTPIVNLCKALRLTVLQRCIRQSSLNNYKVWSKELAS